MHLQEGQALLLAALAHLESEASQPCRIAFIPNPSGGSAAGSPSPLTLGIAAAAALQSRRSKIALFLQDLLQEHAGARSRSPAP
jgi:hypothetical protein